MNHFVTQLVLEDMEAAVKLFAVKLERTVFTPREVEEYNKYVPR